MRASCDWIELERSFASAVEIGKLKLPHDELSSDRPVSANVFQTNGSLLHQFVESSHKFNKNWAAFLDNISLDPVNKPRRDYNEFYLIEKGCAFDRMTNENDFVPLEMISRDFLWQKFPLLNLAELT